MPIQTVCPECDSIYLLADQQAGKKVRCKKCQAVIEVPEPPVKRTAVRGDGGKPTAALTTRRDAPNLKRRADDDEDEPSVAPARNGMAKKPRGAMPWILGGAAVGVGLFLLMCGGIASYFLFGSDKSSDQTTSVANNTAPPAPVIIQQPPLRQPPPNVPVQQPAKVDNTPPVQGQPVEPPKTSPPAKVDKPAPVATAEASRTSEATNNGRLTEEGRERAKRATVYLRVKSPDGSTGAGSGFFGCTEARNIILTNAHVVGMLAPESLRPQSIEVIVNSGEANEWKTSARVLGVDRASDLAVLDIGTAPQSVPEPLTVKSASTLHELDDLYVFGYPFGERLGKEISMRRASVSALRRKNGILQRVQVEGGMDHGNSGGPVLDKSGAVVGVAVGGIEGHQINFAIPGERVQAILEGRISELAIHQPYFMTGGKAALPVAVAMIDPRNLIKQVGLDVWTGDKPANAKANTRPAATTQPAAQSGDSARVYFDMTYRAPEGRADIVLPDLPPGKVYWQQAKWVNAKGQTHWASASPLTLPSAPVNRQPANLVLHYNQGSKRTLDLKIENILKISGSDDDSEAFRIRTAAQFTETVVSASSNGTVLSLRYRHPPHRELITPDGQTHANDRDEQFVNELPRLVTTQLRLDRFGNIVQQAIDPRPLTLRDPQQVKSIQSFHQRIQQALDALSVALPPNGQVNALDSWTADRSIPIDTPGKTELGKINVTFTYQGTRKRDGREEAVINMDGIVRGKDDGIGGMATGQILVDVATGQTIIAETTVKLQLEALLSQDGKLRPIRVLDTMKFRMQRKF